MTEAEIVRKVCVKAYNMDFDEFKQLLFPDDDKNYAWEKWQLMQKDFSRFFCRLDSEKAEKFCKEV